MKRMLINATQEEELRMALVDGQRLYDLNIEQPSRERKKANIYKGRITRIEPSLEAAFVDYGAERHGFLPLKEISPEYFTEGAEKGGRVNIRDVLREGQDIVVQIDKEERGNKGAALTTFVSLAGRFIVLKPNKPRSGGVSRRITGDDRDLARYSLDQVEIPDGMSVILRTAGIGRGPEELEWDVENLLGIWNAILKVVVERPSPFLIYQERDAVIRSLRDYMSNEIGEVLIDNPATFAEARDFVQQVMPHNVRKIKLYEDNVPLFTRYQIESQIESAFAHQVTLPSGGSIVIDHTEALISIDINSARATKGDDIEATALNTNLEAADEIARQLRLRDLGGLIVIDYIDMGPQKNQRAVENRLRDAVRIDRARVQIGKISRFGLLEMSRQRLRPSLGESTNEVCPRCSGMGNIRGVESLALAILRLVGEEARKERSSKVIAQLPADVATYLLNEKREWVQSLEDNNDVQIVLIANPALDTPHYSLRRVRDDQVELPENAGASYALSESTDTDALPDWTEDKGPGEQAAVVAVAPSAPAPTPQPPVEPVKPGLFVRWWRALFAAGDEEPKPKRKRAKNRRGNQDESNKSKPAHNKRSAKSTKKRKDTNETRSNKERQAEPARKRRRSKKDRDSDAPKETKATNASGKEAGQRDNDAQPPSEGGRKRRRSRGRRRNRSQENSAAGSENNAQPDNSTSDDSPKGNAASQGNGSTGEPRNGARKTAEKAPESPAARAPSQQPAGGNDSTPASTAPGNGSQASAGNGAGNGAGNKPAGAAGPSPSAPPPATTPAPKAQPTPQAQTDKPPATTPAPKAQPTPQAQTDKPPATTNGKGTGRSDTNGSTAKVASQPSSPANKPSKPADKERLLPWESAPGVTNKTFGGAGDND